MSIQQRRGKRSSHLAERLCDNLEDTDAKNSRGGDHAAALGIVLVERAGDFVGARHQCAVGYFRRGDANVESRSGRLFGRRSRVASIDQTGFAKPERSTGQWSYL